MKIIQQAYNPFTKEKEDTDLLELVEENSSLIVWNDDVNTFDWVIYALMKICGHTWEQASNCALLIDKMGKYAVKHGSFEELEPQLTALHDYQINATIE